MAEISVQNISDSGAAPTFATAAASFTASVGNGHNTFLVVKNGGSVNTIVTISVPGTTSYGAENPDVSLTIAASAEKWLPLRKAYQGEDTPGVTAVGVSATDSVTCALVRMS